MEFARLNDSKRIRTIGTGTPWAGGSPIPPEILQAAMARGRTARALAFHAALHGLARALRRLVRRIVPRLPAGAHGPEAIDFDCAHGRPC